MVKTRSYRLGTFSVGQRQRVIIARAIVHKPRLLFMNKVTGAPDNRTQNSVAEIKEKLLNQVPMKN